MINILDIIDTNLAFSDISFTTGKIPCGYDLPNPDKSPIECDAISTSEILNLVRSCVGKAAVDYLGNKPGRLISFTINDSHRASVMNIGQSICQLSVRLNKVFDIPEHTFIVDRIFDSKSVTSEYLLNNGATVAC